MNQKQAISHIEKAGLLLVYPIDNQAEPASLWSSFFPRSKMRWEWDSGGDNRVADLWRLREELSRSGKVVYAKWYKGRATFFSKPLFTALLSELWFSKQENLILSPHSRDLLAALEMNSPLSTKELKAETDLKGRDNERDYERGLRDLWRRLLVVGYGEKDDGAFPSLMMGATQLLFEELWNEAQSMNLATREPLLSRYFPSKSPLKKWLERLS